MKSENCHRTASPPDLAPLMVTLTVKYPFFSDSPEYCPAILFIKFAPKFMRVMILKIMMLAILLGYQQLEDSHSIIVYQLPISIV